MKIDGFAILVSKLEKLSAKDGLNPREMNRARGIVQAIHESQRDLSDYLDDFDEAIYEEDDQRVLSSIESILGYIEGTFSPQNSEDYTALLPQFELSDTDKKRVLKLCTDMRKIVLSSTDFDHPHKIRLGNRIAAIEAEVYKDRGLFDVILGGVADVGETLGRFGRDIKPLTDRMTEIRRITQKGTPEYDQIPAPDEVKRISDQTGEC